jgi:hypothetical protein
MVKLQNTVEVIASADRVWSVLGDLTRSPEYIPGIVSARMEDLTRVCIDTNGNEIREALLYYSAQKQSYTVQHIQTPLPVSHSQVQFSVEPRAQKSLVTMEWELNFLDPAVEAQMGLMIDGAAKMTLEQLKTLVEKEQ